ncbi:MAG: hypothetical protein M1818_001237 [Claussenomyces sp. TS43310]|nr:MAG: hypothetical protein M1818_001237 [Claussenomyces sp. TS43310]
MSMKPALLALLALPASVLAGNTTFSLTAHSDAIGTFDIWYGDVTGPSNCGNNNTYMVVPDKSNTTLHGSPVYLTFEETRISKGESADLCYFGESAVPNGFTEDGWGFDLERNLLWANGEGAIYGDLPGHWVALVSGDEDLWSVYFNPNIDQLHDAVNITVRAEPLFNWREKL